MMWPFRKPPEPMTPNMLLQFAQAGHPMAPSDWVALDDLTRKAYAMAGERVAIARMEKLADIILNGDAAIARALGGIDGGAAERSAIAAVWSESVGAVGRPVPSRLPRPGMGA